MEQTPGLSCSERESGVARRRQLYTAQCQLCGSGQGACAKPMIGDGMRSRSDDRNQGIKKKDKGVERPIGEGESAEMGEFCILSC